MSFLLWILTSLVAISLIGDYPYVALGTAGLAGIAFGLNTYLDDRARLAKQDHRQATGSPDRIRHLVRQYGWVLDLISAVVLVFPTRWMVLGFILILISWSLRWWARGHAVPATPFNVPLLALLLMVLVSLWVSADLSTSATYAAQIVAGVNAFYSIVERVDGDTGLWWVVVGLTAFSILLALAAPFVVRWGGSKLFALPQVYVHFQQALAGVFHANIFGGALVPMIALSAGLLLSAPMGSLYTRARRAVRITLALATGLMFAVLLLTQSRGGIAAVLVILALLIVFQHRWVLAPAAIAAAVGIVAFSSRIDWPHLVDAFSSTDSIAGLAGREEVWSRAIYALQDTPFTGIGLWMFSRAVQMLYPLFSVGRDVEIRHAHNLFLQVGVDLGLPGLVAFVALLTLAFVQLIRAFHSARKNGHPDLAALALGLAAAFVALLIHGQVDVVIWDAKSSILLWVFLALVAALARVEAAAPHDPGHVSGA